MILDQFGKPIPPRRGFGFAAALLAGIGDAVRAVPPEEHTQADAVSSTVVYPDEEVTEL